MSKESIIIDINEKVKGSNLANSVTPNIIGDILIATLNEIPVLSEPSVGEPILGDRIQLDNSIIKIEDNTLKYEGGESIGWISLVGDNKDLDINDQVGTVSYFDSLGNLLVTSHGYSNDGSDFNGNTYTFVSKFDPLGNLLWRKSIGSSVGEMESNTIITDSIDNIIVSVGVNIIKFSPTGSIIWSKDYQGEIEGSGNSISARDIVIDSLGNIIVGYSTRGFIFFYKYSSLGTLISHKTYEQELNQQNPWPNWLSAASMVIDSMNNIYVAMDANQISMLKLDTNLNIIWSNYYGSSSTDVVLLSNGNLLLSLWNGEILRISSSGLVLSRVKVNSDNSDIYGLAISSSDEPYLLISSRSDSDMSSLSLLKLNASLNNVIYSYELEAKNESTSISQYWYNRSQGISIRDNNISLVGYTSTISKFQMRGNGGTADLIIIRSELDSNLLYENDDYLIKDVTLSYSTEVLPNLSASNSMVFLESDTELILINSVLSYIEVPISVHTYEIKESNFELLETKIIAKSFEGDGSKLTNLSGYLIPYGKLYLYSKGPGLKPGLPNIGSVIEPTDLVKGWVGRDIYWESAMYLGDVYGQGPKNTNNYKAGIEINYMDSLPPNLSFIITDQDMTNISSKEDFSYFLSNYQLGNNINVNNFTIDRDINSPSYITLSANISCEFDTITLFSGEVITHLDLNNALSVIEINNLSYSKSVQSFVSSGNPLYSVDFLNYHTSLRNVTIVDSQISTVNGISFYSSRESLEYVNFSRNPITGFFPSYLNNCKQLILDETQIYDLDNCIGNNSLSSIEILQISYSNVTQLALGNILRYLDGMNRSNITFQMNGPNDSELLPEDVYVYDSLLMKGCTINIKLPGGNGSGSGSSYFLINEVIMTPDGDESNNTFNLKITSQPSEPGLFTNIIIHSNYEGTSWDGSNQSYASDLLPMVEGVFYVQLTSPIVPVYSLRIQDQTNGQDYYFKNIGNSNPEGQIYDAYDPFIIAT